MNKVKLLAIAPYKGMREMMEDIASSRDDIELKVCIGDLDEGLEAARKALSESDYDMIISRGGTAEMLSHSLNFPILEISITLGDILQAVKLAENYNEAFALIGYQSITGPAKNMCELLNYKFDIYTIHEHEESIKILSELKEKGYGLVISDMSSSKNAQKAGLNTVLITSSRESIQNVFDQAVKLGRSTSAIRNLNKLYAAALDTVGGVVISSAAGNVEFGSGQEVSPELGKIIEETVKPAMEFGSYIDEKIIGGKCINVKSKKVTINGSDHIVSEATTQRTSGLSDNGVITTFNRAEITERHLNSYYGSADVQGNLRQTIESYSRSDLPVVITGESGTGKDYAASFIYRTGNNQQNPFYNIRCGKIDSVQQWQELFNDHSSPVYVRGSTIYFNEINRLSQTEIDSLLTANDSVKMCRHNKVIFSFVIESGGVVQEYIERFTDAVSGVVLHLPPLRERTEDVASLATLYIGQINSDLGRQITGFEPDALELLKKFDWPGNLRQFNRVLRELALLTPNFYISKENTEKLLEKEKQAAAPRSFGSISLHQPLSEITYDVICSVLARENGNQKRASERLGIARSTMWRILKNHKDS